MIEPRPGVKKNLLITIKIMLTKENINRRNSKVNKAIKIYLDYFNNYLSVDTFCLDNVIKKDKFYEYKEIYYNFINNY
jgi:hypothetical protein